MEESKKEELRGHGLLLRYRKDTIQDIIYKAIIDTFQTLGDYVDRNGIACAKGTGDPVQFWLLSLTSLGPLHLAQNLRNLQRHLLPHPTVQLSASQTYKISFLINPPVLMI